MRFEIIESVCQVLKTPSDEFIISRVVFVGRCDRAELVELESFAK